MIDKPNANQTLGLELTQNQLNGAIITYQQGSPLLQKVFSIDIDQELSTPHNVKLLYKDMTETQLKNILHICLVATSLKTSNVLIRPLSLELTKEYDIDQVLEFQAEPLIPYPIEEGLIDRIIVEKNNEKTDLSIFSAKNIHISDHLETMHSINIEPEVISCDPAAIATFAKYFSPIVNDQIILLIGMKETTCVLINNGKLIATQSTKNSVSKLIDAFFIETQSYPEAYEKFINFSSSDVDKNEEFKKALNSFENEVVKLVFSISKQLLNQKISEILILGIGGISKTLSNNLSEKLKKKIVFPQDNINSSLTFADLQKYAIPIGLALSTTPPEKDQINFRQKEFIFPNPWKRLKKPMSIYFSLCLCLFVSIYLFGQAYITSKKDQLRNQYVELLAFMKMPFEDVEEKLTGQTSGFVVLSLTKEDLKQRLDFLEKELLKTPDIFPLLPNIPKATDVLAWLSSHPHLSNINGSSDPQISLTSFSYKLIKRPDLNKKNEKYQVKIELSFTSLKPRYAREFHDSLLTPNDLVDQKGEVKWSVEKDGYRTSFFLKDATVYPTR